MAPFPTSMFKIRNGNVEFTHAIIGGKVNGPLWPEEKK
jgi:hypothetical protein